jgi:hypothetical protein
MPTLIDLISLRERTEYLGYKLYEGPGVSHFRLLDGNRLVAETMGTHAFRDTAGISVPLCCDVHPE